MTRENAKNKTVDALYGENSAKRDFNINVLKNYNYGDQSPVSPLGMLEANEKHLIFIEEDAYANLNQMRSITSNTNGEISFLLFGYETQDGDVIFHTAASDYKGNSSSETDPSKLDEPMRNAVQLYESDPSFSSDGRKQIICHGHTHGSGSLSDNFSLYDLVSYVEFSDLAPSIREKRIETLGLLLPPSGDFNFVMYENTPGYEGFYKFSQVFLQRRDNSIEQLPAYRNGNYLEHCLPSRGRN